MEKPEHQVRQLEDSDGVKHRTNIGGEAMPEPVQHVHFKTVVLLIVSLMTCLSYSIDAELISSQAVVGAYFAQVYHIVGAGFLANNVTTVVGGQVQGTWLVSTMSIAAATLGPAVSQAADYWGRK